MAGASDKARFYLEQAVPQLQEFKEKKIFNEVNGKMPRDWNCEEQFQGNC